MLKVLPIAMITAVLAACNPNAESKRLDAATEAAAVADIQVWNQGVYSAADMTYKLLFSAPASVEGMLEGIALCDSRRGDAKTCAPGTPSYQVLKRIPGKKGDRILFAATEPVAFKHGNTPGNNIYTFVKFKGGNWRSAKTISTVDTKWDAIKNVYTANCANQGCHTPQRSNADTAPRYHIANLQYFYKHSQAIHNRIQNGTMPRTAQGQPRAFRAPSDKTELNEYIKLINPSLEWKQATTPSQGGGGNQPANTTPLNFQTYLNLYQISCAGGPCHPGATIGATSIAQPPLGDYSISEADLRSKKAILLQQIVPAAPGQAPRMPRARSPGLPPIYPQGVVHQQLVDYINSL